MQNPRGRGERGETGETGDGRGETSRSRSENPFGGKMELSEKDSFLYYINAQFFCEVVKYV